MLWTTRKYNLPILRHHPFLPTKCHVVALCLVSMEGGNNRKRTKSATQTLLARTQRAACNCRVEIYSRLCNVDNSLYSRKRVRMLPFINTAICLAVSSLGTSVQNCLPLSINLASDFVLAIWNYICFANQEYNWTYF